MQPLKSEEIFGNWATILLPLDDKENIDYNRLEIQIDNLISMKVNGIYSNGTACEFYNQSEEEFDPINGILADKCNKANQPFQIGCSHASPKIMLERIKRVRGLKPGAIQVVLPDLFPPSFSEVLYFLDRIINVAEGIGVVLYNPPHAKLRLTPEDYQKITARLPLAGCKTSGGNEEWYGKMKVIENFSVFVPGTQMATGILAGASGSYSNVACIHPAVAQRWHDSIKVMSTEAVAFQDRIQLFFKEYVIPLITERKYCDTAIDKMLAGLTGWGNAGVRLRWPYQSVSENELSLFRQITMQHLPEFFELK